MRKIKALTIAGVAASLMLTFSGTASAAPIQCQSNPCQGTEGSDVIAGTPGADTINAGGGNDFVYGYGGDDRISGGAGDDSIQGGDGNDTIMGDDGNDNIQGGNGNDNIQGGNGNDKIDVRDQSADTVTCGGGFDTVNADKLDKVAGDCELVNRS